MAAPALTWQGSLFDEGTPAVDASFDGLVRHDIGLGAWVDHAPGWLAGSDRLFAELVETAPWRQREMPMYGQLVAQPRLTAWWADEGTGYLGERTDQRCDDLPPGLAAIKDVLTQHYGVAFDSVGCNLYRDGRDSVAWHGDRIARTLSTPLVVTVSLGERRRFLLRPKTGGRSLAFMLGRGDLLVMGGTCQHTWQHCVPKVRAAGPRISVTVRHST